MTLKEALEILRGEPIEVFTGDPMNIPCIETSDSEKLCKHPVVSVHMITYNHEPYIRQAIEGVMMQKTDFEFELVIGEDASTDKTREICFEYQKKYPDKIRVLWWHENLHRNPHPAGGNGKRNMAHCRGEFIALCEGDDYWIDPLKLQKQVDVMRKHPNVGLCFCGVSSLDERSGVYTTKRAEHNPLGLMNGSDFLRALVLKAQDKSCIVSQYLVETSGCMFRVSAYKNSPIIKLASFKWRFGDITTYDICAANSDCYFIQDVVSVYRRHSGGATANPSSFVRIAIDSCLVKIYLARSFYNMNESDAMIYYSGELMPRLWQSMGLQYRSGFRFALAVIRYKFIRYAFNTTDYMNTFFAFVGMSRIYFVWRVLQKLQRFYQLTRSQDINWRSILNKYVDVEENFVFQGR